MTMPRIALRGVSRSFPTPREKIQVLRGVDLNVNEGDRIVLFGPSGCGKTTLLHLMALLDAPDAGTIRMGDVETSVLSEEERSRVRARDIGLVFQQFHVLPHHTVRENLQLRCRYLDPHAVPSGEEERLLEKIGLESRASMPARLLSGGEKQRLCIARAILVPPQFLLADEPTGNLDEQNSAKVRELFTAIAERDTPVVIATHDRGWLPFATRILHFENGRLKEETS